MGRRAYLNSLALGRSPYEAPETIVDGGALPPPNPHLADLHAAGYVQEYDSRGHPINRRAKAEAKQLRKAKNDVLSTMGIVVSGEDGRSISANEQEKIALLAEENDYGLALSAVDQLVMFCASWWARCLSYRIRAFKSYNYVALKDVILREPQRVGFIGFYFCGLPACAISFLLSLGQSHFLEPSLDSLRAAASLLSPKWCQMFLNGLAEVIIFGTSSAATLFIHQGHLISLLQSLHLLPTFFIPSLTFMIPFTSNSLIQLPPIPTELSPRSVGLYVLSLITSPIVIFQLYINIRPEIDTRIYRILRRHLPKPDRPDKLSLRVAVENELIEWTVPALGKRSEEELKRSHFTLIQEITYELSTLKNWLLQYVGYIHVASPIDPSDALGIEHYESVHRQVEQLQRELGLRPMSPDHSEDASDAEAEQEPTYGDGRATMQISIGHPIPLQPHPFRVEDVQGAGQILEDEEHRFAQSPLQLPEGFFTDMRAPMPGETDLISLNQRRATSQPRRLEAVIRPTSVSRPNTLFSPSPSPESSPPSSPRVRASLIHQNSDVITMHLELLQSHTVTDGESRLLDADVAVPNGFVHVTEPQGAVLDRAATEILDALLSYPNQHQTMIFSQPDEQEGNAIAYYNEQRGAEIDESNPQGELEGAWHFPDIRNIIEGNAAPDNISTSSSEQMANGVPPRRQPLADRDEWDHRVTILSSHPVDSFASHLSTFITSILCYPLESLLYRSLATTFLSTRPTAVLYPFGAMATVIGLHSDVRSIGALSGGGNATDMLLYIGKVTLNAGFEAAISAGVWGLGAGAAILLGRMKFNWGEL